MKRRLKKLGHRLRAHLAYQVSEWLSEWASHAPRRISSEMMSATNAIATVQTLDMEKLLAMPQESWPEGIQLTASYFTAREWESLLHAVYFARLSIDRALAQPEWAHLHRTPPAEPNTLRLPKHR